MNNTFRVISTSPCQKCDATKRLLKKCGIEFEELTADEAPDLVEEARAEGATSFPIVIAPNGTWWSDFRKDQIDIWGKTTAWREDAA